MDVLRKAMAIRNTDSRQNTIFNTMRPAFQKGLAFARSPDASAIAAPLGINDKKGKGKGKSGNNPKGGSKGTP